MPPGIGGKTMSLTVGVVVPLTQAIEHVRNEGQTCQTTVESSPATTARGKDITRSNAAAHVATATDLAISQGTADLLAGTLIMMPGVTKTITSTTGTTTSASKDLTDNRTTTDNLTISVRTIGKMTGSVIKISAMTATTTARIRIVSATKVNETTDNGTSKKGTELTTIVSKVNVRMTVMTKQAKEVIKANTKQMLDRVC
jgi:hypothetical protein